MGNETGKKKRKITLSIKLNIVTVAVIVIFCIGLTLIASGIQERELQQRYYNIAMTAASSTAEKLNVASVQRMISAVNTDEFKEARKKAVAAGDPQIIIDWMKRTSGTFLSAEDFERFLDETYYGVDIDELYLFSLYYEYNLILSELDIPLRNEAIKYSYLQYMVDGVTYNLVDSDLGPLGIGSIETPVEEFEQYGDNERIPPTVYVGEYGWLCSACETIYDGDIPIALAGVDIDMNRIVNENRAFLFKLIGFEVLFAILCIFVNIKLISRIAVKPLEKLTAATCAFGMENGKNSIGDLIKVDIRSNDEINDLYREIRAMQRRIVKYTDDLEKFSAEEARISTELNLAAEIQNSMLFADFPAFPDRKEFNIFASMDPAKMVGGDFYDFFFVDDDHLAMLIADVSGKGVPAALFMMSSMILLKTSIKSGKDPAAVMADVNNELCANNIAKMFVTVWIGILDLKTGNMVCANAGHEYPAIRSKKGEFTLVKDEHCPVLGAIEDIEFSNYEMKLDKGGMIFVYTDGVPEADNPQKEFYGTERMTDVLNSNELDASPDDIIHSVREDVDKFADGSEQFDDITMLCLRYNGPKETGKK